jgi:hypothetical protein
MYFLIYRLGTVLHKRIFPDYTSWNTILDSFKGIVVELFKNDRLSERDFNNLFSVTRRDFMVCVKNGTTFNVMDGY